MADNRDMQCTSSSDDDANWTNCVQDSVIPECEGIPRQSWTRKCKVLYNSNGVAVAEGICCNISSDVVTRSLGPLGDSHVAIQILSSLSLDDVPDEWRYSV